MKLSWVKFVYVYKPSYFFYKDEMLLQVSFFLQKDTDILLLCNKFEYELDKSLGSTKIILQTGTLILKLSDVKLAKTYTKVYSKADNAFHVLL